MDNVFQISLRDFKIRTIIGISKDERANSQDIIIDIDILYRKSEILDYSSLHGLVIDIFATNHFYYLEDALDFTLDSIKNSFGHIISIDMSIKKPNIFDDCIASVHKKINLENLP